MFVWNMQASYESKASVDAIWRLITDFSSWKEWDETLEWVSLQGPLESGTKGTIKYRGFKPCTLTIKQVEPKWRLTKTTKSFLTTTTYIFEVYPYSKKTTAVSCAIVVGGFFAPFWRFGWAKRLKKELPRKVYGITLRAEEVFEAC